MVEETRRPPEIDADVDNIDQQRMHVIHFRDYPSSSSSSSLSPPSQPPPPPPYSLSNPTVEEENKDPLWRTLHVFKGAPRLGTLFEKVIMVGKIDVSSIPRLIQLSQRVVKEEKDREWKEKEEKKKKEEDDNEKIQKNDQIGSRLTCQSFVERVFNHPDFETLLVEKKVYKFRLYGQMHVAPPKGVFDHSCSYSDLELVQSPGV